ncbi:polymer-forming cytoskeletal protein [Chloroflexota bacterium]
MKEKGVWLGVLILLLLLPASAVFADGPVVYADGGKIYVDEDVSLESGDAIHGDLGIFDGNLDLAEGGVVNGDVFVTNGDADVGGRISGDLAVLDGDLHLAATGLVEGDVFTMGGEQDIAGQIGGSLSSLFGDMVLRSSARVDGDLVVAPGRIEREPGVQVRGDEIRDLRIPNVPFLPESLDRVPGLIPPEIPPMAELPEIPGVPAIREVPARPPLPARPSPGSSIGSFLGRLFAAGFLSVLLIGVGALIVFFWPKATRTVSECIATLPVQSFGLGLLTFLIAAGLEALAIVLMIVIILIGAVLIGTVILIPFGLLLVLLSVLVLLPVPLVLAGGMMLGWVGLADLVGQKALGAARSQNAKPLGTTVVGLLVTVPLAGVLWLVSPLCCGWLFVVLLTSVGLGSVIHTRFGTQGCQGASKAPDSQVLPAEAMDEEAGRPDGSLGDSS